MKPLPEAFLRSLGGSKHAVAESLRKLRVTGLRNDSLGCAIANALMEHAENFGADHVRVLGSTVKEAIYEASDYRVITSCDLPYPVLDFIVCFDRGEIEL